MWFCVDLLALFTSLHSGRVVSVLTFLAYWYSTGAIDRFSVTTDHEFSILWSVIPGPGFTSREVRLLEGVQENVRCNLPFPLTVFIPSRELDLLN